MLAVQYAVSSLITILMIPHIVKFIGLNNYGMIAIGLSLANYAAIIVQYAFHLTGPKQLAYPPSGKSAKDVFLEITGAKLILLGAVFIVFLASIPFIKYFGSWDSKIWFFLLLPVGTALNSTWYFQFIGRFFVSSSIAIIAAVMTLVIGFGMVTANNISSITAATFSLVIGAFLTGIGTFLSACWFLRHSQGGIIWRASVCVLRDGVSIFFSQFTSALYALSGPLIIGFFVNAQAAGAYSTGEWFSNAVIGICLLIHTSAYRKLTILYHDQRRAYWKLMRFVFGVYFACVLPILVIVILAGDMRERFLFGATATGLSTLIWWGMAWVSLGIFGTAITGYLTTSGRQNMVLPLTAKVLIVSLVLGVPGVIYFGSWAWLASLALSQSLVVFVGYIALKNDYKQTGLRHGR